MSRAVARRAIARRCAGVKAQAAARAGRAGEGERPRERAQAVPRTSTLPTGGPRVNAELQVERPNMQGGARGDVKWHALRPSRDVWRQAGAVVGWKRRRNLESRPCSYFTYWIRYLIDCAMCDVLVISIVCIDCAMCDVLVKALLTRLVVYYLARALVAATFGRHGAPTCSRFSCHPLSVLGPFRCSCVQWLRSRRTRGVQLLSASR